MHRKSGGGGEGEEGEDSQPKSDSVLLYIMHYLIQSKVQGFCALLITTGLLLFVVRKPLLYNTRSVLLHFTGWQTCYRHPVLRPRRGFWPSV